MSRLAEMDLAEITDFIARDDQARAVKFEEELIEQVRKIGRAPFAYVERPKLRAPTTLLRARCVRDLLYCRRSSCAYSAPSCAAHANWEDC
jgi:plasmid stabilization system protein ParE